MDGMISYEDDATLCIPDGSYTLSKRPKAFPSGVWAPVTHGSGPYVYTADGRMFADWMCALGALTVGHSHPRVVSAVCDQMTNGALFSLPSTLEADVADRLCEVIPCAQQVRVVKTGSEACSAAIRIARMATGRTHFVTTRSSYHGWHDWAMATKPKHPGVPEEMAAQGLFFAYNDLSSLRVALSQRPIAAVIFEPIQGEQPRPGFLREVIETAHAFGALVIFDEMLSGGRLALGGAQEYVSIMTPDLATFGKAFGGGLPFAFVCGKRDLMQYAWPISGTFSGDALALAAANAMLDIYRDEPVIALLWRTGQMAQSHMLDAATSEGITLTMHGQAPRFWFDFPTAVDQRLAKSVFVQQAAQRGQLVHPAVVFATASMTTRQSETAASSLGDAMRATCRAIQTGTLAELLVGDMYEDSAR